MNGLGTVSRSTVPVPEWARAYHGDVTENREQSEVEGTHASVAVCCIVRKAQRKGRMRYLQVASVDTVEQG